MSRNCDRQFMNSVMSRGKKRSEIDDLFGDLLGDDDDDDLGEARSPSPPVARKGKKVDVYDDAFYEQLAKDNGLEVRRWDLGFGIWNCSLFRMAMVKHLNTTIADFKELINLIYLGGFLLFPIEKIERNRHVETKF